MPARIYDYWLGGKDNYAVDRAAGDAAVAAYPNVIDSVRANRAFLARAVHYLAATAGIAPAGGGGGRPGSAADQGFVLG